jgi:hypothetical protein
MLAKRPRARDSAPKFRTLRDIHSGFSLSNRKDRLVCPLSCSGRSIRSRLDACWLGMVDRRSSSPGWRPQLADARALRRDAVVDCGRNGTVPRDPGSPGKNRPEPSAKTSKAIVRSSVSDASAVFVFLVSLAGFAESQSEALRTELHPALSLGLSGRKPTSRELRPDCDRI